MPLINRFADPVRFLRGGGRWLPWPWATSAAVRVPTVAWPALLPSLARK